MKYIKSLGKKDVHTGHSMRIEMKKSKKEYQINKKEIKALVAIAKERSHKIAKQLDLNKVTALECVFKWPDRTRRTKRK